MSRIINDVVRKNNKAKKAKIHQRKEAADVKEHQLTTWSAGPHPRQTLSL